VNAIALLWMVLAATPGDEVVARIDGATVTRAALLRRADALRSERGTPPAAEVLDSLIVQSLLAAEGRRLGLEKDPRVAERIRAETASAATELLFEKDFAVRTEPPEARLREMFSSVADAIAYESLTFDGREAALAARDRIAKGSSLAAEAPRAVMSQLYPSAEAAPLVVRGQLDPALAKELFSSPPGTVVGPVELRVGVALARALRISRGTEQDYAARRPALVERARQQANKERLSHVQAQLRAQADVKLDEAFLKGLRGSQATPAELDHVIATVKGRPVRYREVQARLAGFGADGHLAGPGVRIQLAWQRVDAVLLEQLAVERGFDRAPEVAARRAEIERVALAEGAALRIQESAAPPTDREIEQFYQRNAQAFGRPFKEARAAAAAGARDEKRFRTLEARVAELRRKAVISVDQEALARATASAR
jgi:hypothetical protein